MDNELSVGLFIAIASLSLACEYIDASIGMGYGTTLTPLLLIIGFAPLEVVPAVLLGQLVGGITGGIAHHRLGNIRLDFRPDDELIKKRLRGLGYLPRSQDSKVILTLALCGVGGALVGAFVGINIPKIILEAYIGIMVLAMGLLVLFRRNHQGKFTWKKLVGVGLVSSFNKGLSGGGYGPLVTAGQILTGRDAKNSIGSTTLAETVVVLTGFLGYLFLKGDIFWMFALATSAGSIVAGPLAALTIRRADSRKLKLLIGVLTIVLGLFTLAKTFVF